MSTRRSDAEPLLTPAEVANRFRVDPKTVTRWAKAGKLTSIRTLGGHRRFKEAEVLALLAGVPDPEPAASAAKPVPAEEGVCPVCTYRYGTPGHEKTCEGK
jgi:excisionase family DNA binding protein